MTIATILAVEDNPTHQYVIKRLCELFEYDVHIVSSAEEALSAVGIAKYAAVLMDLSLPGVDGLECARKIRAEEQNRGQQSAIPIIALTASSETEDKSSCIQAGMNDYLSKPFAPEDLRKILLRWVYHPSRPNLKLLQGSTKPTDIHSFTWDESG
ncbi:MAG: response regulator [Candidatus Obscuribacterales bacterium]|nr:response regulator [Candidatus Obscuribacterales bacterium]